MVYIPMLENMRLEKVVYIPMIGNMRLENVVYILMLRNISGLGPSVCGWREQSGKNNEADE